MKFLSSADKKIILWNLIVEFISLKELNKELTRKLEIQTQRLELLTAQSMVNDGIPARQPDSRTLNDNNAYADEGDEVGSVFLHSVSLSVCL